MKSVKTSKSSKSIQVIETPLPSARPEKWIELTVKPMPGQSYQDAFFAACFSHRKIKSRKAKADRKLRKAIKTKDAQVRSCAISQAVYLYKQVARWEANVNRDFTNVPVSSQTKKGN